jgi:hypothetical protein
MSWALTTEPARALVVVWMLATFATYRLAQLIALDDGPLDCLATLRGLTAYNRKGKARAGQVWASLRALVNCPYCLGVWFGAFTTMIACLILPMGFWTGVLFWLAVAGGQCALQSLTDMVPR